MTRTQREALELLAERPLYVSTRTIGLSLASGTALGLERLGFAYRRRLPNGVQQLVITKAGREALKRVTS